MEDAKGKELKVGDIVLIPATVTSVSEGDHHTLYVETLAVIPGTGITTPINGLNTKQVYRANKGDKVPPIKAKKENGKTVLV